MNKKIFIASMFLSSSLWASTYNLDMSHSRVGFSVKHLMISNVKGHFDKVTASFDFDKAKSEVKSMKVDVDVTSINTSDVKRDDHLKSGDFFETSKPENAKMTFVSDKAVKVIKDKSVKVNGVLTLKGVSKPVTLDVKYLGDAEMAGTSKVGFTASAKISRKDFGMSWNKTLDKGGLAVGDEVLVEIEGEANLQKEVSK